MNSNNDNNECPDFAQKAKKASVDENLFEQIVQCFSSRLENFAAYYCNDPTLGKDAFQEAMISALRNLDSFRGESPIEPWLRKIVVSSCSRLRRGKKNDPKMNKSLDETTSGDGFADTKPNQEISLMMAQHLALIKKEIDNLDEPNKSLLTLHDIEEIPIKDLAQKFEMTTEAVKSRLKRSRSVIRDNLLTY